MRRNAQRRPASGIRENSSKNLWPIFFFFGVVAVFWVMITVMLIPQEIAEINNSLWHSPHQSNRNYDMSSNFDEASDHLTAESERQLGVGTLVQPTEGYDNHGHREEISMKSININMREFLNELERVFKDLPNPEPLKIWDLYKAAADKWLLPMDRKSKGQTLFDVRTDQSIFVSVASYRDEHCPTTLTEMFSKAQDPNKVFIGLVQQNCVDGCKTGVLEGGIVQNTSPDIDCYEAFCKTALGSDLCKAGNVRNFFVDEANALGPAVARYFASKLWFGETYFMQIDAHSLFEKDWDSTLITDIINTPSYPRSVLSHYPPDTEAIYQKQPGYRICGAIFASSPVEYEIVRLSAGIPYDSSIQKKPCPAPFIGAGFFFAHSSFLADVPFDPYVPWVFMGEEILLSLRFWTWGYDIYSPTRNVLSHFYVRRHTPKFWETVNRLFHKPSIHNEITSMVINRVKNVAGYPESSADVLMSPSLLGNLDLYGDGNVRAMEDYMDIVGLDMTSKRAKDINWCSECKSPYAV